MISQSWLRLANRRDGLAHTLDTALSIAKRTVFFGKGDTWQDNVRQLRGLGQEDILYNQKFSLLQAVPDVIDVWRRK